jgi:GcrA cell cycle regulator
MPEALTPWSDVRTRIAVNMWTTTAASASDIANFLGGTSRRAVLGKLYRLGELGKRRPSAITPAEKVARPPRNRGRRKPTAQQALQFGTRRPKPRAAEIDADTIGAVSTYLTATIFGVEGTLALKAGQCRWPFGDPRKGVAYCGRECSGSYCNHHHRRAHQ